MASLATCCLLSRQGMGTKPMKKIQLTLKSIISLASICAGTLFVLAQTSSPTKMTLAIQRGPAWTRLRTAIPAIMAGGGRISEFGSWNVAVPLKEFGQVTLFDALEEQNALFVSNVEGTSAQKVSPEIPKNLDYNLTEDEDNVVK